MKIIINNASMQPIYDQVVEQIKAMIMNNTVVEHEPLPSVRTLAKELKISALTVKKAYDKLEEDGFIVTVHGKGSFIASANPEFMQEEHRKEVESLLEQAILKGRKGGMSNQEITDLFTLIMEDKVC